MQYATRRPDLRPAAYTDSAAALAGITRMQRFRTVSRNGQLCRPCGRPHSRPLSCQGCGQSFERSFRHLVCSGPRHHPAVARCLHSTHISASVCSAPTLLLLSLCFRSFRRPAAWQAPRSGTPTVGPGVLPEATRQRQNMALFAMSMSGRKCVLLAMCLRCGSYSQHRCPSHTQAVPRFPR
jgi:hypothetical protein